MPHTKQPQMIEINNNIKPSKSNGHSLENGNRTAPNSSFIQRRAECSHGPEAFAQGFSSPKKQGQGLSPARQTLLVDSTQSTELARKSQQLSLSKDYGEFSKKLDNNSSQKEREQVRKREQSPAAQNDSGVDLPVFRHLCHELSAQFPTVPPGRSMACVSAPMDTPFDDHESVPAPQLHLEESVRTTKILMSESRAVANIVAPAAEKDGNYFLKILKDEQTRLLKLAAVAEKYSSALANNHKITEETFGLLRSASGKARLLASNKMKQFEGLCIKNLHRSPEDEFPTTVDDLEGFWDMVYLQVEQVNSIFASIEQLKSNDWKGDTVSKNITTKLIRNANSVSKTKSGVTTYKQLLEMKRQRHDSRAAAAKNRAACECEDATDLQEAIGDSSINNFGIWENR